MPTACLDLPCEWAQFQNTCAGPGLEDNALILIATWHRQGPAMTQQLNVNHGHPDRDLMTSILAYEWYLECVKTYSSKYTDWKINTTQEWKACTKVGLIHHVLIAIHESVLVLLMSTGRHFRMSQSEDLGAQGIQPFCSHSVWTSFFDRCPHQASDK